MDEVDEHDLQVLRVQVLPSSWDLWSHSWPLAWDHFAFEDPIRSLGVFRHVHGGTEPSNPPSTMQLK